MRDLPPGPTSPAWWQLTRFTRDPLGLLDDAHRRFGDTFTLNLAGSGPFVMLSNPEAVREVFRGDPDVLHSGEANRIFRASVGASSVLVLDGAHHQRQRRVVVPPLKGERMRAFFDAMRHETVEAVRRWKLGAPFAAVPEMRRITLRVILRAGLGLSAGATLDHFERKVEAVLSHGRQRHALLLMTALPIERLSKSRWVPLFRQLNALNDDLFALIAQRRSGAAPAAVENVLDELLAATYDNNAPMSDQEVRDAIFTILVAGYDTTSYALGWALVDIVSRPTVAEAARAELGRVVGDALPGAEDLPKLEYLEGAVRESLRINPVVPFVVRLTRRPFVVAGREYPPGVVLCPCSYLVHRRPDLYPEPLDFRPERFQTRRYGPSEWFPFGGGGRVCLGMPFALYEMQVVLATILTLVTLKRPAGAVSRSVRHGVILGPDDGARVLVETSRIAEFPNRRSDIVPMT